MPDFNGSGPLRTESAPSSRHAGQDGTPIARGLACRAFRSSNGLYRDQLDAIRVGVTQEAGIISSFRV